MAATPKATTIPTVDDAAASAYFATTPRDAAWLAITPPTRTLQLLEAERWLRGLCPDPDKEGCCGVFADAWVQAVSELALALYQNPTALIGGAAGGTTGEVKRQKLGDLEQEFFQAREGGTTASRYGPKAPLVLRAFPWLGDILGCWLPKFGGAVIKRWRS